MTSVRKANITSLANADIASLANTGLPSTEATAGLANADTTNLSKTKADITSLARTRALARELAQKIAPARPLLLFGGLGAGKTELAREAIRLLTGEKNAPSPTFNILQTYGGGEVFHYDLYRLKSARELDELDFDAALFEKKTIIEWPEIAEDYIDSRVRAIKVKMALDADTNKRSAEIWNC
ncbi:MAG: tRNA (adenosine(37)-N6)-threonylcarbamoyltransferase complex ATPase subunit type 1 TsaE [Rickettsiales bacterium]|jgi:tRNA threonylcarbamoyladenosine biosynthesis protein TsaE|nr:tRNA (adenosine(37)-N6)-threonylcarbamoyltransferase complex ATPase subunit type 1 TsaE [Rickettsiales bacterium]